MTDRKIYLASASPRRRELLRQIGIDFEVIPANLSEHIQEGESPEAYVRRAAADKAVTVSREIIQRGLPPRPVLGADTIVVLDGGILGKPRDREHGLDMLGKMSGRTHQVLTAVVIVHAGEQYGALSSSRVTFGVLDEASIARYWETGEPVDKAGAYAIQGRGAAFVARIEGSYSGVVGLPLYELAQLLSKTGIMST